MFTLGEPMRRNVLAALCVAVLALSTQAHAAMTVLYEKSGTSATFSGETALPGPGEYHIWVWSSKPTHAWWLGTSMWHWDIFVAPPPRPHHEYLDGNNYDAYEYGEGTGNLLHGVYTVPEDTLYGLYAGSEYEWRGIDPGTELYYHGRYENPRVNFYGGRFGDGDLDYKVVITRGGPVPEPATWAMMLTGFFAAGAVLRRRRGQPALASAAA